MTINERVRQVRSALNLTQVEFGSKTGISQGHLTAIESGKRAVTPKTIKVICATFNISESWLENGSGEMFSRADESIVDQLAQEFNLDEWGIRTLNAYMKLDTASRKAISRVIIAICKEYGVEVPDETESHTAPPMREPLSIKEQADLLRARADALEKGLVKSTIIEKDA